MSGMQGDNHITEYIDRIKENLDKEIYIYGAGNMAKSIYLLCRDNGIEIKGFLVTDIRVNVSELLGLPVKQFDAVKLDSQKTFIIIGVIENGVRTIANMLKSVGLENYISLTQELSTHISYINEDRIHPMMEITTVMGCSINCRYCPQSLLLKTYYAENKNRTKLMGLEEYKKCIDKLPQDVRIRFAGFVEPFLNPQCIEMIEYASEQGREIDLYTTLVGLSMEGFEKIRDISFRRVVLHTADADGYANIPITKEYLDLVRKAVQARKADGSLFIDWANCQSTPHSKVLDIIGGRIRISAELYDRAGNVEDNSDLKGVDYVSGVIECVLSEEMNRTVLLPDGTVVLCCNDYGLEHPLGNLLSESYENIIDGKEMRRIKEACRNESLPLLCRKCVWAKKSENLDSI